MATSTKTANQKKIVGALFDDYHDANRAVDQLVREGYPIGNIALLIQTEEHPTSKGHRKALEAVGYENSDRIYFEKAVREGKTLVSVTNLDADETGDVISILNENGAHYDPDGSRNVRDDVVGMTTGAAVGAAAGAFVGPIGAAVGALAGGAIGAAIGTQIEENE
jgi:hypothetical protein